MTIAGARSGSFSALALALEVVAICQGLPGYPAGAPLAGFFVVPDDCGAPAPSCTAFYSAGGGRPIPWNQACVYLGGVALGSCLDGSDWRRWTGYLFNACMEPEAGLMRGYCLMGDPVDLPPGGLLMLAFE